jgi:hypothetical protein
VGAAALLSSCSAGEEEPADEEHAISSRPGKKTLKSPKEVKEELEGTGETITLTIDKEYEKDPNGTWKHLLEIIEAACKKGAGDEYAVVTENGLRYWVPAAKKTVKLDLSATSLAVYGDLDNDGKYNDYGDLDNDDNDDYDGGGVFVFDPRNPVHEMYVPEWASEGTEITIVVHYPYDYDADFFGSNPSGPSTGEPYITELTLPDKATAIAGYQEDPDNYVPEWTTTFAVFTRLKKVTANGVEIINDYAFFGCGSALAEASFPKVESIGFRAFEKCEKLTRLFLPAEPPGLLPSDLYPGYKSGLFTLWIVNYGNEWHKRDDTLFIYVNGGDAAVYAYVDKWEIKEAEMPESSTEVYGILQPGYIYHMPVTIEALKWSNGTK